MKTFLIVTAVLYSIGALVSLNTKPGEPRAPHGSARQLMVVLLLEVGFAGWALWLYWSLP